MAFGKLLIPSSGRLALPKANFLKILRKKRVSVFRFFDKNIPLKNGSRKSLRELLEKYFLNNSPTFSFFILKVINSKRILNISAILKTLNRFDLENFKG